MKPFFCFLGGKWRLAPYYPAPKHGLIIEPFAGAAGYSVRHSDSNVLLLDKDPVIVGIWSYLIKTKPAEIRRLTLKLDHIDDVKACQEAKWLIGFWLDKGGTKPAVRPSPRMRPPVDASAKCLWQHRPKSHWGPDIRERIASQVDRIKHWKVREGDYSKAPTRAATWFVDPPYQVEGGAYVHGSDAIDYKALGRWCRSRVGQVIVCENGGATWLPFKYFRHSKSTHKGGHTVNHEVIWSNGDVGLEAA